MISRQLSPRDPMETAGAMNLLVRFRTLPILEPPNSEYNRADDLTEMNLSSDSSDSDGGMVYMRPIRV